MFLRSHGLPCCLRFTVPVLWDSKNHTMVNNESSDIMRMFNTAFNDFIPADKAAIDLYPSELRAEIDSLNDLMYKYVNSERPSVCGRQDPRHLILFSSCSDGVSKAGYATTAEAYEQAVYVLFETLDKLEIRLQDKDYLIGDKLTESDVRLWVTMVSTFLFIRCLQPSLSISQIRFDPIYVCMFKCNIRDIRNGYPAIELFVFLVNSSS
jgi:glutathionyl-hydroquinone reductase